MHIAQISYTDLIGQRFNGHSLHLDLNSQGIGSTNIVWRKQSNSKDTVNFTNFHFYHLIQKICESIEARLSIQSITYPFSWLLSLSPAFRQADIVHYHLIHNYYFNFLSLPFLSCKKPTVWTLHDPWALTGHCVHPYECTKWQSECNQCPHLNSFIPMKRDHTRFMFNLKKYIYRKSNLHIVVGSPWMKRMVEQSPLLKDKPCHIIPFGIDTNIFKPLKCDALKKKLNIPVHNIVLAFRADNSEFKGYKHIAECLEMLSSKLPITLLKLGKFSLSDSFKNKYQVIEGGWISDEAQLAQYYNLADIFIMPSMAESFGMMAIEAMACEKPVIVFDGTALPDTVHAPMGGISVPYGNSNELVKAVEILINNPGKRKQIGKAARSIVEKEYDFNRYVQDHINLYSSLLSKC